MSWFTENPTTPVLLGLLAIFALLAFAYMLKMRKLVYVAIGVAILTIAVVVIESQIVTDRETIEATVHDLALAVEDNDIPGVTKYASTSIKARIEREMPRYEFEVCNILNLEPIEINETAPVSSIVRFQCVARGTFLREQFQGLVRRKVELKFRKENDRWVIVNYRHYDPSNTSPGYDVPWEVNE